MGTNMSFHYPEGLRFTCVKCGICCGDTAEKTRHVLLNKIEAERIASATELPILEFASKIERNSGFAYEMKKTTEQGKCFFLAGKKCRVYSQRPLICRFYPFELRPVENTKHEFRFTDECPGLGRGRTFGAEHFRKLFKLARKRTLRKHR
jgi:Fe-S-cluster containining protein